jgi:hypothetical protein
MTAYKFLLASVLLSASPDATPLSDAHKWQAELAPELRVIALQWQLLDPKEAKSTLASAETFWAELHALQMWNQTLLNAPWVEECGRFPQKKTVGELILANRNYKSEITDRLVLAPIHKEELESVIAETEQLFKIWDALRDAHSEHYGITYRRQALHTLRDLIGAEAFYRGQLPPALPVWRFARN